MKNKGNTYLDNIYALLIAYIVFSFLWITFSDSLVSVFVKDSTLNHIISTVKGLLYAVLTASFIMYLINRSEMRISSLQERYKSYFEQGLIGIIVSDQNGRIVDSNWMAEQILGCSSESEMRGRDFGDVFKEAETYDGGEARTRIPALSDILVMKGFSDTVCTKIGGIKKIYLKLGISVVESGVGNEKLFVIMFEDISDKVRLERMLKEINHVLEKKVEERTRELNKTIKDLEKAHNSLVVSERMSALGELVSGITHEINTPVGISITATSYLEIEIDKLRVAFKEGRLKKAELESILISLEEASDIIHRNLEKASDIISSFKQVSTDMHSYQKRKFFVKSIVEDTITSLKPFIRKGAYEFEVRIDDVLEVTTYPGAINQILGNFIVNSINHGFEGRDRGRISIRSHVKDGDLYIDYSDDGRGVPDEDRNKIFTPYFTTKRDSGGSGLGLSVVYKLIVDDMGGDVSYYTSDKGGAGFMVRIPIAEYDDAAKSGG